MAIMQMPYGWHMWSGGWLMMLLMAVFWLLILAGIIFIVVWIAGRAQPGRPPGGETPLDVIKMRYARGEISRDEFERLKQDLA